MLLRKITDKGPSKVKEAKFKQQKTCRDEIIECAQTVMRQSGLDHFTTLRASRLGGRLPQTLVFRNGSDIEIRMDIDGKKKEIRVEAPD